LEISKFENENPLSGHICHHSPFPVSRFLYQ